MKRRQLIQAAGGAFAAPALASLSALSFAQTAYPTPGKPITWIVGYGAGGNADSRSRQIAKVMGQIM
jgi:tripartite-type tricarboxylate transporter receptor subunit TctC